MKQADALKAILVPTEDLVKLAVALWECEALADSVGLHVIEVRLIEIRATVRTLLQEQGWTE
jgi:hypothetical protein